VSTQQRTKARFLITILFLLLLQAADLRAQSATDLVAADTALLIGDYETAIGAYNAALTDPTAKCAALYGLGVTHLRAFQYAESNTAFTNYLGECGIQFRVLVMRGQGQQQLGHSAEALADYQQAIDLQPGVLDSYLYERIATLDPDRGIYYLRLAAEAPRDAESKIALRETLAEAYLLVGNIDHALTQYDLILHEIDAYMAMLSQVEGAEFDKEGFLRARIEYTAAQLEIDNDRLQAGYDRLQQVITRYPETRTALPALIDLIVGSQPVDLLIRMQINVHNENYFPVVDVLTDYLNNPATRTPVPTELFLLLGRAQRGRGNYDAARETFSYIKEQFPDTPEASRALLELGHMYQETGNAEQALQTYLALNATYPQAAERPEAILSAANLARTSGDSAQALTLYRTLAHQYPESEQTQQEIFAAGLALIDEDRVLAAELFELSGTAKGLVWAGQLLQQTGNLESAQQAWQQATVVEPGTFFAMRGCALLNDIALFSPSDTFQNAPFTEADRLEAEQWVADVFGLQAVSSVLSPELANDPLLQRGTELWSVGLWAEARAEFDSLHKVNRDNPVALLQLAFHYQTIPVYRSSLFAATRLLFASEQHLTQVPRVLLQLAYPVYFADVFIPAAAEYALDPLLLGSLVRQESSFDPTAQSVVGARGLMQLMPATAQDVAARIGWIDFTLSDLLRPMMNIELGSYYLSSMLSFQGGSVPGALLSYNAGPGNVAAWLQVTGDDLEQLYETVPFAETKLYLKLIAENYTVYKYLYGDPVPMCMFDGLQE
jgi:soluble lytic murein transglycosylase